MLVRIGICAAMLPLLVACASEPAMPEADEGRLLFVQNCAACHGSDARGGKLPNGRIAPDLTRIAARNDGTLPRAQVLSQIDGYGKGQAPADIMPEFGALLEGDLVPVEVDGTLTPTPRPLAALLVYLESIQAGS